MQGNQNQHKGQNQKVNNEEYQTEKQTQLSQVPWNDKTHGSK